MAIKFHYEYTKDWLIERPAAKDYYDDIVKKAGDAFVNSNTGWEYSGSNTVQYVNPTITASDNLSIRTIEVHHTTSDYYIRFWLISPYSAYNASPANYFPYINISGTEYSNELTTGLSAKRLQINDENLYSTSSNGSYPKLLPGIFFYAINNSSIGTDFGYKLNTLSNLCPLDSTYSLTSANYVYGYSGYVRFNCEITSDSSGNTIYPGGYGKIFWVLSDTLGNYFTFGFGDYNSSRKHDRCFCAGNLLSNLDSSDSNKFIHISDYYIRQETSGGGYISGSNSYSILDRTGRTPSSSSYGIVSFNNYYPTTLSKLGVQFKGNATNNTHITLLNPVQFRFGNTINYTPIRVYTTEYDSESQLISNGQANKGFIDTEYMRYIGTSYPGTSENLWRTFDNKNWMMLCPGWLFRWDPDAPDMRNF